MHLQYISDSTGKTTGVFIPIEEWEGLKNKFKVLKNKNKKLIFLFGILQK